MSTTTNATVADLKARLARLENQMVAAPVAPVVVASQPPKARKPRTPKATPVVTGIRESAPEVAEAPDEDEAPKVYVITNPEAPASFKQAGKIAGLTGFFPSNKQGWTVENGFTKGVASEIITTVINGGSITVNGHEFSPDTPAKKAARKAAKAAEAAKNAA